MKSHSFYSFRLLRLTGEQRIKPNRKSQLTHLGVALVVGKITVSRGFLRQQPLGQKQRTLVFLKVFLNQMYGGALLHICIAEKYMSKNHILPHVIPNNCLHSTRIPLRLWLRSMRSSEARR